MHICHHLGKFRVADSQHYTALAAEGLHLRSQDEAAECYSRAAVQAHGAHPVAVARTAVVEEVVSADKVARCSHNLKIRAKITKREEEGG